MRFPKPTRIGDVELGSGIVHAVTHRNALCLLSRLFFTV
jgi:hypothetical protein